jgi:hypothetical protein
VPGAIVAVEVANGVALREPGLHGEPEEAARDADDAGDGGRGEARGAEPVDELPHVAHRHVGDRAVAELRNRLVDE